MLRAHGEEGAVLQHRGVLHPLGKIIHDSAAAGREMGDARGGDEDAVHRGGDAEGEIEVFAAHPKIPAMQPGEEECIALDE